MARKDKPQRRIDQRAGAISLSNFLIEDFDAAPELEINTIDLLVPSGLAISGTTLAYSAYTPTATINLAWDSVYDRQVDGFVLQWATTSGFADPVSRTIAGNLYEASIDSLPTDSPLYFRVASRFSYAQSDWSDYVSTTTAADTIAPLAPSGLLSAWSSRTGDLTLAWTNPPDKNFDHVKLKIYTTSGGSLLREVQSLAGRYVWTLAQQASDTSGTYDPSVYVTLTAFSSSNVPSVTELASTLTLTLPSAVTATAVGAFSAFTITSTATSPDLLLDYRYRIYKDSVLVATIYSASAVLTYTALASGSYQADVTARDALNQLGTPSALTTAVTLQSEDEFVTRLRAGLYYTDSEGTAQATLNELKDSVLTSGGPTYSGGAWRWIQGDWGREIRHETTTLALSATVSGYLGTSLDASSWLYHYGGTVSGGIWTPTLTTSTEATAQATPAILPSGITLISLAAPVQTRFIELSTFGATNIREFYPRTLVQADDIVVENLSAISANLGSITAGTVTGATIRTAATGQRVELTSVSGIRGIDSSGVTQVQISPATGELIAGLVTLNDEGVTVNATGNFDLKQAIKWGSTTYANTYSYIGGRQLPVGPVGMQVDRNYLDIAADPPATATGKAMVTITAEENPLVVGQGRAKITLEASTVPYIFLSADVVNVDNDILISNNASVSFGNLLVANGDLEVSLVSVILLPGAITREAWIVPGTFTNGWTGTNFAYYKSADNIVRFRGRLNAGTLNANVFQLLGGYRPATQSEYLVLGVNTAGATVFCRFFVGTGGFIQVETVSAGTLDFVDCSAVSFRVD